MRLRDEWWDPEEIRTAQHDAHLMAVRDAIAISLGEPTEADLQAMSVPELQAYVETFEAEQVPNPGYGKQLDIALTVLFSAAQIEEVDRLSGEAGLGLMEYVRAAALGELAVVRVTAEDQPEQGGGDRQGEAE